MPEDHPKLMSSHASNSQLRVGIAGLGMAGSIMIPALGKHPETILAGAAEPSPKLRDAFAAEFDCPVFETVEALVSRDDVDAVYIATPHQFHREHTVVAASRGKHVVVEKPMALSLADCDAMIEAAEASGVSLLVGHTHGFDAPVRRMREIIDSGSIGPLRMVLLFNFTDFLYRPRRPEELDTARGGGILFNQIPHQIEIVRTLTDSKLLSVSAATGQFDTSRPTEGALMAQLGFADGTTASLTYSGYDHFDSDELHGWIGEGGQPRQPAHGRTRSVNRAMQATGKEAQMRADAYGYGGPLSRHVSSDMPMANHPHFGFLVAMCERGDVRHAPEGLVVYSDDGLEVIRLPEPRAGGGRWEVLDELCDAALRNVPPRHDGRFARATVAATLAILESARDRRQVFLT